MEDDSEEDNPSLVEPPSRSPARKSTKTRPRRTPDRGEVPISTGNQYKRPKVPDIGDVSNPSLHSENFKFRGMSQQQEVLLAVMDAQLNELKEEEQVLPDLRAKWVESASDILTGAPPNLPPLREVNHKIPLIDESKQYNYHLPRCPDALKTQLSDKIQRYTNAGWWEETNVSQAAPMLCVLKKSTTPKLRTVIDGRKRNDNTVKDVTPFPDQEEIRNDVARAKYRSKIDMSDAYEQIRVEPNDVWKTAFSTVYGTFVSHTMQQGDCNAPATFQRLMTTIFREFIGKFVHVYLDDIFVFSESIEEHEKHLGLVFDKLRKAQLFLEESKLDLYSKRMDCLGHIIDDRGIHADTDKMSRIREWRTPKNKHDVQRFLGLVQYLAHFMPDVTAYTGPLAAIQRNGHPFHWRPIHQVCMDNIKRLACKTPILRPIDPRSGEPIWLICDASASGIGCVYGQGPTWETCRPAGFMSKKFTAAQHNYRVFEMETIAILEGLLKWEDKLIGHKIHVVTDHRALEFFKTQRRLSSRQMRWMEYLSRFDYDIQYVKGSSNKVADSLSRFYQSDTDNDVCQTYDYVNADLVLDPEGEDLPWNRIVEIRARREVPRKRPLCEAEEERGTLAKEMAEAVRHKEASPPSDDEDDDPTLIESLSAGPELTQFVEKATDFLDKVRNGYKSDPLFSKIMEEKERYATFSVRDGLVYMTNKGKQEVLCIPRKITKDYSLTATIIDQAHAILGHFGAQKTADYIRRWYWWPRMGNEITKFCDSCGTCQANKTSTQRPVGLLHPLPIPNRPWGSIGMDFMGPFPESEGYDYLWVIICRLTSQVHLVPVKTTIKASELAWIYVKEVVRLHGLPDSIVSDRDSKFTSKFWRETHRLLGTKLLMSTAFHPQTDGATERANRSIGQVLRTMIQPDQRDWVEKLPMTEFALNSCISSSTGFAPFELNYGFLPMFIGGISPNDEAKPGIKRFLNQAISNLEMAHDAIIESRVTQTRQANRRRRPEDKISEGDKVYLSTENLSLPKSRTRKLMPKYIGPYKVTDSHPAESRYTLDLPAELKARRIHPTFHVSRLRPYTKNDDRVFPKREARAYYDFGDAEDNEWLVDDILAHRWDGNKVSFLLQWNLGDTTWEPYTECKELAALDRYLELLGIDNWQSLPRKTPAVKARDTTNKSSSRYNTREELVGSSPPTDAPAVSAVRRSTRLRKT
jgi:RNase H-like domain found in reverse transcriptase/Reverse transcriptase (RNA-dependent DNA polymerase)/Integrase zinc binding domain